MMYGGELTIIMKKSIRIKIKQKNIVKKVVNHRSTIRNMIMIVHVHRLHIYMITAIRTHLHTFTGNKPYFLE